MEKNNYLLAALFLAATIGFSGLIWLEITTAPTQVEIREIHEGLEGKKIIAVGTPSGMFSKNTTLFFELSNNGKISAVFFNPQKKDLLILKSKKQAKVTGTIKKYNGKLELIVKEVE